MNNTSIKALVTALTGWLLGASVPSLAQDADSSLASLIAILEQTATLQADVDQLTLDQNGREIQETSASMVMRKPDHFYWHATKPYEELMATDGERIWIFEPDLEQVTIQLFQKEVSRTPALLLSEDEATLRDAFAVSATSLDRGNRSRFLLTPLDPASLFENLSLTFTGVILEEMQFEDSLGQRTSLIFSNVVLNEAVDESLFSFEPPVGIEVIDSTQTAP